MTVSQAAVISVVVFALLGSSSMVRAAEGQQDGWRRDVTLGVARGVDRVSNFLSLNRPLDWVNGRLGRGEREPDIVFPPTTLPASDAVTTTTIPPRVVSATNPLRLLVVGDSQADGLGTSVKKTTSQDPLVDTTVDGRVSTGLARPDYYNWPARLQETLLREDADAVVLMVGANDDQNLLNANGSRAAVRGTPEWETEYRRRVAGLMDLVNDGRRRLIWVGEPLVARPDLNATLQKINGIVEDEAAHRSWVEFVETSKLLAGPNGEYVDYLTPAGGAAIRCRAADGVHLTSDCNALVTARVMESIRSTFPSVVPSSVAARATTTTAPATTTTIRVSGA